jgi:hypothetical protein
LVVIVDSEDAANPAKEQLPSMMPEAVTLEDAQVREVAANAERMEERKAICAPQEQSVLAP